VCVVSCMCLLMFCGVNSGNDERNLDFDACRIVDLHGEKKCDDNNS